MLRLHRPVDRSWRLPLLRLPPNVPRRTPVRRPPRDGRLPEPSAGDPVTVTVCAGPCGRAMARSKTPPPGLVAHKGRGMCRNCYETARVRSAAAGRPTTNSTRGTDCDVDDVAVARAISATWPTPRLNAAERAAAVAILTRRGHSQTQIADRIGITARTVCRHRSRARQVAA